jgi:hypothetical protein
MVLVRLTDGATGAHEPGTVLDYETLAAYVSDENIAALVDAEYLREVTDGG